MVCSIEDGAIAEVISAIDQLAADSRGGARGSGLRSRIAGVWAMLAALDPELARLRAAYEQAGAGGSRATEPGHATAARGTRAAHRADRGRDDAPGTRPAQVRQAATTSMSMVAVTSGCSRTFTW